MEFKAVETYLVEYGVQEDGKEWGKEKLKAVTPNLVGQVVKLPDGTLALVYKMWFDSKGLRVQAIPKDQVMDAIKGVRKPVIVPGDLDAGEN